MILDDRGHWPFYPATVPAVDTTVVKPESRAPARLVVRHSRPPGRPRDEELTFRLLEATTDILSKTGWESLNSDRLAAAVCAGKAGIYRRWRSMPVAAAAALRELSLVTTPDPAADAVTEIVELHSPCTRPPDRAARAVAACLSASTRHPELAGAIHDVLWAPLTEALTTITDRHALGVTAGDPADATMLLHLSQGWWCRHLTARGPTTDAQMRAALTALFPTGR